MSNTIAAYYRGGYSPLGACVGYEPGIGCPSVARYRFSSGAAGATALSFKTADARLSYADNFNYAYDHIQYFRFAVTEAAGGYENYCGSDGQSCGYRQGEYLEGRVEKKLLPNRDYYLWIFPNYRYYSVWSIGGCTVTLEGSYAEKSTVKAAGRQFGSPVSIILSRSMEGVTHTVTAECGGKRTVLAENSGVYPNLSWTPGISDYAPLISDANSASAVIRAESFLNGESLGVSTAELSLSFPAGSLKPTLKPGWVSLAPYNTGSAAGFSCYISGYSRVKAGFDRTKIDESGLLGGRIVKLEISPGQGEISPVLTGETEIVCSAVDSRGNRTTQSFTVTPLEYHPPRLQNPAAVRCLSDGTESEDGEFFKAYAKLLYSELEGMNVCSLTASWRYLREGYTGESPITSEGLNVLRGASADMSFEVRLRAVDGLGNETVYTQQIPGRSWAMKFRRDGQGLAFGKAPEFDKSLELPEDWEIRRGQQLLPWGVAAGSITEEKLSTPLLAKINRASVSLTKLWENASPTSSFGEQWINLDLRGYDGLLMVTSWRAGNAWQQLYSLAQRGYTGFVCAPLTENYYRWYTVYDSRVEISNGYCVASFSDPRMNNSVMVPLKMYGVKGVS